MSTDKNTNSNIFLSKIVNNKRFGRLSKIEIFLTLIFHKTPYNIRKKFNFVGNTLNTSILLSRYSIIEYYTEYNKSTTTNLGIRILDVIHLYLKNQLNMKANLSNVTIYIIKFNLISEQNTIIDVFF